MRIVATVYLREVLGYFYAPIAYVLGSAFWAVQGFSFWALMRALSDPRQPAEVGAVLRQFFGGTLLHWLVVFSLLAMLSMRTIAEEKRDGMWESMLTTRAQASSILVAKWLALVSFYCLLWLPTLLLIYFFTMFLPPEQALDWGPVASAYLGIIAIGAALAAIGIAISSLTSSQVVAGIISLVVFLSWLMLGELGDVGATGDSSQWVFFVNLRLCLESFARGEVDLARLLSLAFVAVLALCAAASVIGQSKTERNRFRIACIALVVAGASASSLAGKHWVPGDWTAHSVHTLDSSSRAVLASVRSPLEVVLVRPSDQVFDPVFEEVERLIARMVDSQPLLAIRKVDPLLQPEKIQEWAFELGIQASELSSGGAVIFVQDGRRRVVDFMAMADYSFDDLGVGSLSEFRAEAAFRQAIAEVTLRRRDKLCVTTGHGELESEVTAGLNNRARWSGAASRLRAEGVASTMLEQIEESALSDCDALLIHGPSKSFSAAELRALDAYLTGGGNALIALRSLPSLGAQIVPDLPFLDDGLKLLLAARGMIVLNAVVVDPDAVIDAPPEWMTYEGYGEHAIVRDFHQRRATLWLPPRALSASNDEVLSLLEASSNGWAEHDMTRYFSDGGYEKSDEDTADIAIALVHENANKGRLVLFGSAESLSDHWGSRGVGGNERLLVAACLWTLHRDMQLSLPSKELEHLHLVMSQTQLRDAFIYMVVLGPLLFALLGALCWWWRRREE